MSQINFLLNLQHLIDHLWMQLVRRFIFFTLFTAFCFKFLQEITVVVIMLCLDLYSLGFLLRYSYNYNLFMKRLQ